MALNVLTNARRPFAIMCSEPVELLVGCLLFCGIDSKPVDDRCGAIAGHCALCMCAPSKSIITKVAISNLLSMFDILKLFPLFSKLAAY